MRERQRKSKKRKKKKICIWVEMKKTLGEEWKIERRKGWIDVA